MYSFNTGKKSCRPHVALLLPFLPVKYPQQHLQQHLQTVYHIIIQLYTHFIVCIALIMLFTDKEDSLQCYTQHQHVQWNLKAIQGCLLSYT
jgi:hypothetical protein